MTQPLGTDDFFTREYLDRLAGRAGCRRVQASGPKPLGRVASVERRPQAYRLGGVLRVQDFVARGRRWTVEDTMRAEPLALPLEAAGGAPNRSAVGSLDEFQPQLHELLVLVERALAA